MEIISACKYVVETYPDVPSPWMVEDRDWFCIYPELDNPAIVDPSVLESEGAYPEVGKPTRVDCIDAELTKDKVPRPLFVEII